MGDYGSGRITISQFLALKEKLHATEGSQERRDLSTRPP